MFLIHDTMAERHRKIRGYDKVIGVILAAVDFEWTVRWRYLVLGESFEYSFYT